MHHGWMGRNGVILFILQIVPVGIARGFYVGHASQSRVDRSGIKISRSRLFSIKNDDVKWE